MIFHLNTSLNSKSMHRKRNPTQTQRQINHIRKLYADKPIQQVALERTLASQKYRAAKYWEPELKTNNLS